MSLTVLVTRTHSPGRILCDLLKQAGMQPIAFPTLDCVAVPDAVNPAILEKISVQDCLIFVSPAAAEIALPLLSSQTLSKQVQFAAMGAGTANILMAAGYYPVFYPNHAVGSEALLKEPAFADVAGRRLLLAKGRGGRDYIHHTLQARGAHVTEWVLYERRLPSLSAMQIAAYVDQPIDVIVCTSFEAVRNLKTLVLSQRATSRRWPTLSTLPLLVVSERIKKLAQTVGFQRIWVAQDASHIAILQALQQFIEELS